MSKNQAELGGLYAIPGADKFGLAKVIYLPRDFRNVILIRLYQDAYEALNEMRHVFPADDAESTLFYTGNGAIKTGGWLYLGRQPVSAKERGFTKRLIGGGVWLEDNYISPASDEDISALKQMSVHPYRLVEKIVSRLDAKRHQN